MGTMDSATVRGRARVPIATTPSRAMASSARSMSSCVVIPSLMTTSRRSVWYPMRRISTPWAPAGMPSSR